MAGKCFNHQIQNTASQGLQRQREPVADFHYGFLVSMQFFSFFHFIFSAAPILSEPAPSSADSSPVFLSLPDFCFRSFVDKVRVAKHAVGTCDLFCQTLFLFRKAGDLFFQVNQLGKRNVDRCLRDHCGYRIVCDAGFVCLYVNFACSCQSSEEYSTVFEGFLYSSIFRYKRIRLLSFDGGTFILVRTPRMLLTASFIISTAASSSAYAKSSVSFGHAAIMMESSSGFSVQ